MATRFSNKQIMELPDGKHRVEKGLFIVVKGNRRNWQYFYSFEKKQYRISLGSAVDVPYANAKTKRDQALAALLEGKNPLELRRASSKQPPKVLKFADLMPEAVENIASVKLWKNKKHGMQWINTLKTYAVPVIGDMDIDSIGRDDILRILKPIWKEKAETASRVRGRLEKVFTYFISKGIYKSGNPAVWKGNLEMFLPPIGKVKNEEHHESMPHGELKEKIGLIYPPSSISKALILFTILTASRIGESAPAKWEEFDLEKGIWECPPERRKDGKKYPHRVPLSHQLIEMLRGVERKGEYVFYSETTELHISRETPRVILQRIFKTGATIHGMRSTFRDWCAEKGERDVLAEKSLMHATGSEVVQAYQRSDLLEQRRELMQRWSDYLLGQKQ